MELNLVEIRQLNLSKIKNELYLTASYSASALRQSKHWGRKNAGKANAVLSEKRSRNEVGSPN